MDARDMEEMTLAELRAEVRAGAGAGVDADADADADAEGATLAELLAEKRRALAVRTPSQRPGALAARSASWSTAAVAGSADRGADRGTAADRAAEPADEDDAEPWWRVGAIVEVAPRCWPGINRPGGVGRITEVSFDDMEGPVCSVKYLVGGGKDAAVPKRFVGAQAAVADRSHRPVQRLEAEQAAAEEEERARRARRPKPRKQGPPAAQKPQKPPRAQKSSRKAEKGAPKTLGAQMPQKRRAPLGPQDPNAKKAALPPAPALPLPPAPLLAPAEDERLQAFSAAVTRALGTLEYMALDELRGAIEGWEGSGRGGDVMELLRVLEDENKVMVSGGMVYQI